MTLETWGKRGVLCKNRVSLLRMVTGRERLLHDVELGRRHVLVVRQREQEGFLRGDIVRFCRLTPRTVAETAAYLATHPLKAAAERTSPGILCFAVRDYRITLDMPISENSVHPPVLSRTLG